MVEQLQRFLANIDDQLAGLFPGRTLKLYMVGRAALVLQFGVASSTRDCDVLRTGDDDDLLNAALDLFGQNSAHALVHGIFLEAVPPALPQLPANYRSRATLADGQWRVLQIFHLDPNDLAVSKLKRFAPRDREDIRVLCDFGLLNADVLRQRLESAFLWSTDKDGDAARDGAFSNLETVINYLNGKTHLL